MPVTSNRSAVNNWRTSTWRAPAEGKPHEDGEPEEAQIDLLAEDDSFLDYDLPEAEEAPISLRNNKRVRESVAYGTGSDGEETLSCDENSGEFKMFEEHVDGDNFSLDSEAVSTSNAEEELRGKSSSHPVADPSLDEISEDLVERTSPLSLKERRRSFA